MARRHACHLLCFVAHRPDDAHDGRRSNFTMNLTLMQDGYAGLEHTLPISPFLQ